MDNGGVQMKGDSQRITSSLKPPTHKSRPAHSKKECRDSVVTVTYFLSNRFVSKSEVDPTAKHHAIRANTCGGEGACIHIS
jgi:hypothetical protein